MLPYKPRAIFHVQFYTDPRIVADLECLAEQWGLPPSYGKPRALWESLAITLLEREDALIHQQIADATALLEQRRYNTDRTGSRAQRFLRGNALSEREYGDGPPSTTADVSHAQHMRDFDVYQAQQRAQHAIDVENGVNLMKGDKGWISPAAKAGMAYEAEQRAKRERESAQAAVAPPPLPTDTSAAPPPSSDYELALHVPSCPAIKPPRDAVAADDPRNALSPPELTPALMPALEDANDPARDLLLRIVNRAAPQELQP